MASFSCATGQASSKARELDSSWNAFAWSWNLLAFLLGEFDDAGAGDEPGRRVLHAGDGHERLRELDRVALLVTVHVLVSGASIGDLGCKGV